MVVLAVLVLLGVLVLKSPRNTVYFTSSVNGRKYMVRRAPDAAKVADRLAVLESTLHTFLARGLELVPGDPRLESIRAKWDGTLSETEAFEDVAFTVDKRSVSVCLRDSQGNLEPLNNSLFVLFHELAHVCNQSYGHDAAFWDAFKFLLEVAEKVNVYRHDDHDSGASTYCGHPLGASPLTCVKRQTCASTMASGA